MPTTKSAKRHTVHGTDHTFQIYGHIAILLHNHTTTVATAHITRHNFHEREKPIENPQMLHKGIFTASSLILHFKNIIFTYLYVLKFLEA